MKIKRIIGRLFMIICTVMCMMGVVTREDLYRYIGSIEPDLRRQLEEADRNAEK